jgi:hypothetical protein
LSTTVPSLLKRQKRLQVGLDASAKAYAALCKHYKKNMKQWLKDDQAAQKNRQDTPSSMDIYDTVKQKGGHIERELPSPESLIIHVSSSIPS